MEESSSDIRHISEKYSGHLCNKLVTMLQKVSFVGHLDKMKLSASCIVHPCPLVIWTGELQLFPKNEEYPVSMWHKLALIKSLVLEHPAYRIVRYVVRCIMCYPTHLFKPTFLKDFLYGNQALMRSDNLNAECCSVTNKDFLFRTAFKSKTHPVSSPVLVPPAFKQDSKDKFVLEHNPCLGKKQKNNTGSDMKRE